MLLYSTRANKGGMRIDLSYIKLFVVAPEIHRPQPLVPVAIQSSIQLQRQSDTEAVFSGWRKIYWQTGNC